MASEAQHGDDEPGGDDDEHGQGGVIEPVLAGATTSPPSRRCAPRRSYVPHRPTTCPSAATPCTCSRTRGSSATSAASRMTSAAIEINASPNDSSHLCPWCGHRGDRKPRSRPGAHDRARSCAASPAARRRGADRGDKSGGALTKVTRARQHAAHDGLAWRAARRVPLLRFGTRPWQRKSDPPVTNVRCRIRTCAGRRDGSRVANARAQAPRAQALDGDSQRPCGAPWHGGCALGCRHRGHAGERGRIWDTQAAFRTERAGGTTP